MRDDQGNPVRAAAVRLVALQADGQPVQRGPTIQTDTEGRYLVPGIVPRRGETSAASDPDFQTASFTLVVEAPGRPPENIRLTPTTSERSDPEKRKSIVREVVVPTGKS